MNKWEAKYKVLAAGITDKSYIDNAGKLVETSINLSVTSNLSFAEVFYGMLQAVGLLEKNNCPVEKTEAEMAEEAFLALEKIGCSLPPKDTIGWICPVCGKGNAPFAYSCENCEGSNV